MKQISFFKSNSSSKTFGGELLKNKRKSKRPLSVKKPIHGVLRADLLRSESFFKYRNQISLSLELQATRSGVKIYRQGLARDHVHLVLKFSSLQSYKSFVRAVTGIMAKRFKIKWLYRPFTRIVEWGRDFTTTCAYVLQNELEGLGVVSYRKRKRIGFPNGRRAWGNLP
jgi:hypothetical protein